MRRFLPFVLFAFLAVHAHGQKGQIPGFRISPPPKIDGVINEDEWKGAPSASGFVERSSGGAEPENTQFWLAFDEKYLYFVARMEDKDPKQIRAAEYRSNVTFDGDDSVTLTIDPFGRTGSYNQFSINARGATGIAIAGGRAAKREWLGEFSAAGRVTATGWEVEARIPWGVMRLPSPGIHEPSIEVFRSDPRHDRKYIWLYSPNGNDNYGKWTGVQTPKSGNLRLLKLLPYAYTGWARDGGYIADSGLDMKANITDQIDLVGSINPDFRNVENSILSLDFSHFERLAAESRPFFLEGADSTGHLKMPPFSHHNELRASTWG